MNQFIKSLAVIILLINIVSCKNNSKQFNEESYLKSVQEWKEQRLNSLKSENGWLNLVGLYWLEEGENPFGSSQANNIIFPANAPEFIGSYSLYQDKISVRIEDDVNVYINDSILKEYDVLTDMDENTSLFKLESFRWYIIKRGEKYGIRLRDLNSPLVEEIKELPYFPVDVNWRVEAQFKKFDSPKEIAIPNVLGDIEYEKCYGELLFKIDGKEYSLMPLGDGVNGNLFLIFGDETSAEETYGAGRFLSVEKPDENGNTYIDFNKATNPPCAFTDYATCPLPPKENILPVRVTAGEKINEHFGHH